MNQLSRRADSFDLFSDEHDDAVFTLFADAFQLPFDGEGRIILPPALAAHAEISDRAAFAGKGNTFQIWHPERLAKYKETVETRTRSQGFRLPPQSSGGGP